MTRADDAAVAGEVWQEADNVLLLCVKPGYWWQDFRGARVPWDAPLIARPLRRLLDTEGNLDAALAAQEGERGGAEVAAAVGTVDLSCELYDAPGQDCITAGPAALAADGCTGCRVRAAVADPAGALAEVKAEVLRAAARGYDETEAGPGDHAAAWLRERADRIEAQS